MHPLGTNNPKAWPLVFPLFSGAPAQCREDEMKLDLLRFQKGSEVSGSYRQGSSYFI